MKTTTETPKLKRQHVMFFRALTEKTKEGHVRSMEEIADMFGITVERAERCKREIHFALKQLATDNSWRN